MYIQRQMDNETEEQNDTMKKNEESQDIGLRIEEYWVTVAKGQRDKWMWVI